MNIKKINTLLEQYKSLDLDMAIMKKEKELVKQKLKAILDENGMNSFTIGEFKISSSEYSRVMYIKKSLEKYVDEDILNKCSKVINMERTTISYEK